jgi:O-antigen/teichoic acid export membrane protein
MPIETKSTFYSDPLIKTILLLVSGNFTNYFFMFLISLIVFRSVDRHEYGLFVTINSFLAIFLLLMAGYNQTIERYLKESISTVDKQKIISFSLYYRFVLLVVMVGVILIFRNYEFFNYFQDNENYQIKLVENFIMIGVLATIISMFIQVNKSILKSMYQYKFIIKSELISNILTLACVIYLTSNLDQYIYILCLFLVIRFLLALWISFKLSSMFKEYSLLSVLSQGVDFKVYKKYIKRYSLPLKATSILTYFKNNLPILIIGSEFGMEDVGIYSIIKNFFKTLHSLSGSFLGVLTSKFVELKNNFHYFEKIQNLIYYMVFFTRAAIYIFLIFLIEYFFEIYKINITNNLTLVYLILGLEYVIAGVMESYGVLLLLHDNTYKQLYVSLLRVFVEGLFIYLLLFDYGVVGAALVLLLSRYFETFFGMIAVFKDGVINLIYSVHIVIIPAVIYFLFESI